MSVSNGHGIITDITGTEPADLEQYLAHLRALPFVQEAMVRLQPRLQEPARPDALLVLRTRRGTHRFLVEVMRTNVTYAAADRVIAQARRAREGPWILFAPYVAAPMGRYLAEAGINYVDLAGNCHLAVGKDHFVLIQGQRPVRIRRGRARGMGAAGHQVLFAILARPELLDAPVRTLAEAAGVGKTTAANTLRRLAEEGLVGEGRSRRRLLAPDTILDRWLHGYETLVRPRLMVGRFRTPDADPETLERRVEHVLAADPAWAWGGGAAAMRLTKHYRGEETVIHADPLPPSLPRRLRALPAEGGTLTILGVPGRLAFDGVVPRTVHPLLVYTELAATGNERAREAALEIRERYLETGL